MIRQSILPASYERLEYIENTSTAYIDCGLKPKYTFDYEIKTNIVTGNTIFGYVVNFTYIHNFRFFYINENMYFDIGHKRIYLKVRYEERAIIHAKFGNYFIENVLNKEKVIGDIFDEKMHGLEASYNLLLFEKVSKPQGKVWLLNINDNGKPIRKFIPVKRKSDGMIGMYDLVGRKFYTSPNRVAFTGG